MQEVESGWSVAACERARRPNDDNQFPAIKNGEFSISVGSSVSRERDAPPQTLIDAVKHESMPIVIAIAAVCVLYVLAMKLTAPKDAQ